MKINKRETIFLEAEEVNSWSHMYSILREIYNEANDDEIRDLSLSITDYMEMLEKYLD